MLIFAAALKNPGAPLVREAAIWFEGNRIRWAGAGKDLPAEARRDARHLTLANTLLLPGLVNAHAHLELSHLEGFPYPGSFTKWIRAVLAARDSSADRGAASSLHDGIRRAIEGGTTCVGDHIGVTGDLGALLDSPLRGCAFLEILGVVPEVARDIRQMASILQEEYRNRSTRWQVLPSPHSVHALDPEYLREILATPQALYSLHLGESQDEAEYFANHDGELFTLIAERGSDLRRPASSAVAELQACGDIGGKLLAVHGNYFGVEEIDWLAKHQASIVHCPLSHEYFAHRAFPMEACLNQKVNIALGTDSLASARSLSMLDVLRSVEMAFPNLGREKIFHMATLGGAKALGMDDIGCLAPAMKADVIGVPFRQSKDDLESLFQAEQVAFVLIDGDIVMDVAAEDEIYELGSNDISFN